MKEQGSTQKPGTGDMNDRLHGKKKKKKTTPERIPLDKLPKYTEIKQMVEATLQRMLLEPPQPTQSPDVIVFQNGVLDLTCPDPAKAFTPDEDAVIHYSHALWSFFNPEIWRIATTDGLHLINNADHCSTVPATVKYFAPVFYKFMCEWFPGDKMAFETILRWFGYCMTTSTAEQKFMFFYGPTRAGKGSLARVLCGLVGSTHYSVANYSAFEDKFQAIGMHDKLVVTMEEVEATPKEHERRLGMLKKYLGGERIVWEQKYARSFEDEFVGKIIMQSNEVLAYEDKGRSVTSRMIPMEFSESFFGSGEEAPDKQIFAGAKELNPLATLAALCWYRMRRNKIRGAFDFKNERWSIGRCKACKKGEGSLLLESHKILWPFLHQFKEGTEGLEEEVKSGKLLIATRNNLKELTEKVLEINGKPPVPGNFSRTLKEAVKRDFPKAVEKMYKIKGVGQQRGWKGLYIDAKRISIEYPEVLENTSEFEDSMLRRLS